MDRREAIFRISRWTPSAVVFPPYHSGCFLCSGLRVPEHGLTFPHFYFRRFYRFVLLKGNRVEEAPAFTCGEVLGQVTRNSMEAEAMKGKTKKGDAIGIFRQGMVFQDKATECFEQFEVEYVSEGTSEGFIKILPRRQREQVCRFHVAVDGDGTATIEIEEKDPFIVSPVLGRLAFYLAVENGETISADEYDPYVPFKSTGEIIAYMQTSLHREFTDGALRQAIHRLRKILAAHDCGEVLQTNRQTGAYRIRLRRKKMCALACGLSTPGGALGGSGQQSAASGG
jgi:hypothetical protein